MFEYDISEELIFLKELTLMSAKRHLQDVVYVIFIIF